MLKVVAFMKQVARDYRWRETLVLHVYRSSLNAIIAYRERILHLMR